MIIIEKDRVGKEAYKISNVWKIGIHTFKTRDHYILRLNYLRNKKGTHYIQISKKRKSYDME